MPRLIYVSAGRFPSEHPYGVQIMQNCEAFAQAGAEVELWLAARPYPAELRHVRDLHTFYGVEPCFTIRRLPALDLIDALGGEKGRLYAPVFYLLLLSFGLFAALRALFSRADIFYSRDPLVLWMLSWVKPRRALIYEAHRFNRPGWGRRLQTSLLRRIGLTAAVTPPLRADLLSLVPEARIVVAHDGVRRARFENPPTQAQARQLAGWPPDRFIVGYMGQLHTMGMAKGVDTLIEAIAQTPDRDSCAIALVGGPDDYAAEYRALWARLGLPPEHFLYSGQVVSADVPKYLAGFDVCVMPLPRTEHFALHASPLKLFEYMASARALIATDLPGWADVVADERDALLVPPSDAPALAAAITRLRGDAALRQRLAQAAYQRVMAVYTWEARARMILQNWNTAP